MSIVINGFNKNNNFVKNVSKDELKVGDIIKSSQYSSNMQVIAILDKCFNYVNCKANSKIIRSTFVLGLRKRRTLSTERSYSEYGGDVH